MIERRKKVFLNLHEVIMIACKGGNFKSSDWMFYSRRCIKFKQYIVFITLPFALTVIQRSLH